MTVNLSPVAGAGWQFFDSDGVPLSGGELYTYAAGTTTPQTTYTSSTGLTANTNPIGLNSAGRVSGSNEVWLTSTLVYKFILKTSTGVQVFSADDISGMPGLGSPLTVAAGGTGRITATAYAVVCGGDTSTNPLQSIAALGSSGQMLTSNGASALPTMQTPLSSVAVSGGTTGLTTSGGPLTTAGTITLAGTLVVANGGTNATTASGARTSLGLAGTVLQIVNSQTGAVSTGTTVIPQDDTIPQNTEGNQYMSLAITPTSATSKLRIDVVANGAISAGNSYIVAIFQDSTVSALAAINQNLGSNNICTSSSFSYYMVSGTTSATTFNVRCGVTSAGTFTFNGQASARLLGGVMASSITITEIAA